MGRVYDQRGAPAEIISDAPSVSAWISMKIQSRYGRQKMVVEIHNFVCGGIKIEHLIKFTCFYLKNSQVHVFCSNLRTSTIA